MNKGPGGQHVQLCNRWYMRNSVQINQSMSYLDEQGKIVQKKIQRILEERNLWPTRVLKLKSTKPKCFNCHMVSECKICVRPLNSIVGLQNAQKIGSVMFVLRMKNIVNV